MSQTQTPSAYVTPECRAARTLFWRDGHLLCPGPFEVRQPPNAVAIEVLRYSCSCHDGNH
ncbi:hypothetical protein ABT071_22700 [Streptomyces sp. NPDC002506]|uniref:hypothetical protein n=1 Tax=Streptomyces sp. NPDC002506 TaxID=3154536 RepID=UPI00332D10C6